MASLKSSTLSSFSLLKPPLPTIFLHTSLLSSSKLRFQTCTGVAAFSYRRNLTSKLNNGTSFRVKSQLQFNFPVISPDDHWGLWSVLFSTGAFGLWSEKTKIGSMISSALVSILIGLAASNLRIIPYEAKAYSIVLEYLLPLTVPLLLFRANLRQVVQSTGRLLLAFLLGSGGTILL